MWTYIEMYLDTDFHHIQGPIVQSIVSLMSSLVVKMLTVLVNTLSSFKVFLLKNVSSFWKCKSYSHSFSKNISVYAIFNDQSFNNTLTNEFVSFEQLGSDIQLNKGQTVFGQTGLSKQCRARSEAAEFGFLSGSTLFATHLVVFRHSKD